MSGSQDDHNYANAEELAFLKLQTGIQDEDALKAHVVAVQKKAAEVHDYPCIRRFGFIKIKINKFRAAYQHVLHLGQNVPGALLLDIGCCFGNDLRKIASDGFPAHNMVASDLRQDFWDLGHQLFRSTPDSFPVVFLAGDAFDSNFLSLQPLLKEPPQSPAPDLHSLTSLSGLHGRLSAIHSASLFHLFSEDGQLQLARKLASLLVPRPGSIIFGCHGAQPTKGYVLGSKGKQMFCHSPESWRDMWNGEVFERGSVEVSTHMVNAGKILNETTDFHMLFWSIKRL
ncbi:hypothetical protein MVEN_02476200 [Mycena venus]|uniref:Methyltransferase domain-containing protein n=1 Tax=Mycena venus TaxID=2733690 RepID=A0A8H6WXB1_9AGAR|nr:hypothetical protein MVEN_02476200 [Mycena venus]